MGVEAPRWGCAGCEEGEMIESFEMVYALIGWLSEE